MTEREKEILKKLSKAILEMSESKKEYLLGYAEGIMASKDKEKKGVIQKGA